MLNHDININQILIDFLRDRKVRNIIHISDLSKHDIKYLKNVLKRGIENKLNKINKQNQ